MIYPYPTQGWGGGNYAPVKNRALDLWPTSLIFIFLTFGNLLLNRQHILQQNLTARSESQQQVSTPASELDPSSKRSRGGQSVFELQIQVKRPPLLQTAWLVG